MWCICLFDAVIGERREWAYGRRLVTMPSEYHLLPPTSLRHEWPDSTFGVFKNRKQPWGPFSSENRAIVDLVGLWLLQRGTREYNNYSATEENGFKKKKKNTKKHNAPFSQSRSDCEKLCDLLLYTFVYDRSLKYQISTYPELAVYIPTYLYASRRDSLGNYNNIIVHHNIALNVDLAPYRVLLVLLNDRYKTIIYYILFVTLYVIFFYTRKILKRKLRAVNYRRMGLD